MEEAFPAVMVPVLLKTGFREEILSSLYFEASSSSAKRVSCLFFSTILTGTISSARIPPLAASICFL